MISLVRIGLPAAVKTLIPWIVVAAIAAWVFASRSFRRTREMVVGGVVIGAVIVGGWYLSGHSGHLDRLVSCVLFDRRGLPRGA